MTQIQNKTQTNIHRISVAYELIYWNRQYELKHLAWNRILPFHAQGSNNTSIYWISVEKAIEIECDAESKWVHIHMFLSVFKLMNWTVKCATVWVNVRWLFQYKYWNFISTKIIPNESESIWIFNVIFGNQSYAVVKGEFPLFIVSFPFDWFFQHARIFEYIMWLPFDNFGHALRSCWQNVPML